MVRSLAVFVVILSLLFSVIGCSAISAGHVESPQVQKSPNQADADTDIGSSDVAPYENKSVNTEAVNVKPVYPAENGQSDANGLEPIEDSGIETTDVTDSESRESVSGNKTLNSAVAFHDKCAGMLKSYVDERGLVDYKTLRRKRLELRAVLKGFSRLDPGVYKSWSEPDEIAFWINVYNLQKLSIVTDHYPIKPSSRFHVLYYWSPSSIRHIETEITGYKFLVMDEEFTFAEIERRFFRHQFHDPRIFFAITDACLSSPPLRKEPYYGDKLDEQLEDQTKKFLSGPLAFKIDRQQKKVYLSALFQLSSYGGEFIEKFATDKKFKDQPAEVRAVLNFISNYISAGDSSFLEVGNYTIVYMSYDWTINDGS